MLTGHIGPRQLSKGKRYEHREQDSFDYRRQSRLPARERIHLPPNVVHGEVQVEHGEIQNVRPRSYALERSYSRRAKLIVD
jgi:hypothetical protein